MNYCLSNQFGLLAVKGTNAAKFLQGQATCDVVALNQLGARGAFCTPKGRVYSSFYICPTSDGFLLRMHSNIIQQCIAHLKKYSVFYKVDLIDVSSDYQIIFTDSSLDSIQCEYGFKHIALSADVADLHEIWFAAKEYQQFLQQASMLQQDEHWLDLQLVRCGLFDIDSDSTESWLPHNMGLQRENPNGNQSISYTKGCYTGQEIVARTHHLGKVKKILNYMKFDIDALSSSFEVGGNLLNAEGKSLGKIVKVATSDNAVELLYIGNS